MKNNDLKEIWKMAIDQEIKPLSDTDLNDIVIKSARKSIHKLYPMWGMIVVVAYLSYTFCGK